jgi:2-oxoisovalerate dehydrogenase E2 component (dihydrolipoyl transacylase)
MRYDVKLPSLGEEGVDAVTVSVWLVDEGQTVHKGDDLVELVTDKAAFTLPAPKKGTLTEKVVAEGDEIAVGEVLCIFDV